MFLSNVKIILKPQYLILILGFTCFLRAEQSLTFRPIGSEAQDAGSYRTGARSIELRGWATGLTDTADALLYAFGTITGDFDISVRCSYLSDTAGRGEAGLMIRTDTTDVAPFISITYLQDSSTFIRYRLVDNNQVSSVVISKKIFESLRIKRNGDKFTFLYKDAFDTLWNTVPTKYRLTFPTTIMAGIMYVSHTTGIVKTADFENIQGFPEEVNYGSKCTPILYDFENGSSLAELGFRNVSYWELDTGNFIRTNTSGFTSNRAQIVTPLFSMNLGTDTTNISWGLKYEGDTLPVISDYLLYCFDTMTLGDRANINGRLIGTSNRFVMTNECNIVSNIISGGDIAIGDRCNIQGNLTAHDTVHAGSGSSISGSIIMHASPQFPVIKLKNVIPGTSDLTVNPRDSVTIFPGSYKSITIGDNSKVVLRPGIYNLENFKFDTDVKIYVSVDALNRLEINVRDTLQIADRCRFLLSDANTSKYIQIYSHQDFQNRLGTDIQLAGSFYFPRAGVVFSSRGTFINGGVYANKIQLEPDGQITSGSVSLHSDNLTTAVYPALTGEDTLFLDYKAHRSCFLDTIKDIVVRYGNSTIKSSSTGIPTPVNTQLSFKLQFFPMGTANGLKIFYNDGHGFMKYFDSIPIVFNTINSLGYYYTTGIGADNRQAQLDNILLSCTRDTCPQIIIKNHPENKELYAGERALFTCEIESTSVYPVFQWYRDNKPIPHANSPVYSISSVDTSDDGALFHCSISNKCYSNISRNARLTVLSCNPPVIITQSVSDTVSIHDTIRLSVNALGLGLRYQWQESNRPIESATDSVYTINGILSDHNLNEYSVIITNSCGKNAISKPITLYVRNSIPCKITKQPVGDTVEEKDYFITEAGVSCENGTITWLKNGVEISGADNRKLVFGPVTASDNGSQFICIVSNGITSDTSNSITIKVKPPKTGRNLLAVSGKLYDGNGVPQGYGTPAAFEFKAVLYATKTGGIPLYTEHFKEKRAVIVRDTAFTVTLGRGIPEKDNLQEIVSSHHELYIELYTSRNNFGNYELVAPRLKLTAAPYAFSSGVKVMYGTGNPDTLSVGMPPGTLYIDQGGVKVPGNWLRMGG